MGSMRPNVYCYETWLVLSPKIIPIQVRKSLVKSTVVPFNHTWWQSTLDSILQLRRLYYIQSVCINKSISWKEHDSINTWSWLSGWRWHLETRLRSMALAARCIYTYNADDVLCRLQLKAVSTVLEIGNGFSNVTSIDNNRMRFGKVLPWELCIV